MLWIHTSDSQPPEQVRFVRASVHAGSVVEHFADRDAATEQLFASGLDVGDDQVQALGGARCRGGDVLAENDRASGARRRELDHPEVFTAVIIGVQTPAQRLVEAFGAVYVGDWQYNNFEFHVHEFTAP